MNKNTHSYKTWSMLPQKKIPAFGINWKSVALACTQENNESNSVVDFFLTPNQCYYRRIPFLKPHIYASNYLHFFFPMTTKRTHWNTLPVIMNSKRSRNRTKQKKWEGRRMRQRQGLAGKEGRIQERERETGSEEL